MRNFTVGRRVVVALLALVPLAAAAQEVEPNPDPAAWRAEVAAARARAEQHRATLKAEFARNKVLRALEPPVPDHVARARIASDQAFNDLSLQRGDIVSTMDGLFVFNGDEEGVRSRLSFSPAAPAAGPRP